MIKILRIHFWIGRSLASSMKPQPLKQTEPLPYTKSSSKSNYNYLAMKKNIIGTLEVVITVQMQHRFIVLQILYKQ